MEEIYIPKSLKIFFYNITIIFYELYIVIDIVNVIQNKAAPNRVPILYEIPLILSEATKTVIKSASPFGKARKVTAASYYEIFKYLLIIIIT
jgi:hypothetical protein